MIDAVHNRVIKTIILNPIDVSAFFQSDGNTLAREPLTTVFDNPTKAFPNLLEAIVIKGNRAYVPGTCSSPNGPFRFNVNVQSCLSVIDTSQDVEAFADAQHERGRQLRAGRREALQHRIRSPSRSSARARRGVRRRWPPPTGSCASTLDAQGVPTINPPRQRWRIRATSSGSS